MTSELSDSRPRDVEAELTAVKALLRTIIITLGNRDRDLALEIINTCPRHHKDVHYLDRRVEAVAFEFDDMLGELRSTLGRE